MSVSQNFPTIFPSLSLDFASVKKLDSRITFSRPTGAVYYDGKSVTKAEENLFAYSQEFNNAYWSKFDTTVTPDTTTAPNGTTTADTLTENGLNSAHQLYGITTSAGVQFVYSIFVKANGRTIVAMRGSFVGTNNWISAQFDLSAVTATLLAGSSSTGTNTLATITDAGDGWYRCAYVFTPASGHLASTTRFLLSDGTTLDTATGVPIYTGDGTSGVFVWGAQLEQRDTVTAYTPTTTQPITNYIPTLLSAPADTARFDHDPVTGESLGLLVEEQRTNLLVRSEEFDNASWTKTNTSVTANIIVAPDGTLTGDKLVDNTSLATHGLTLIGAGTATSVLSVYAKKAERSSIALGNASFGEYATFDLTAGSVTSLGVGSISNASMVDTGNGWYRCSCLYTYSGVARSLGIVIVNGTISYTGDGYSGIYIWGAQLEAGSFPTSYVKTEASQVTRSADSASMTGANFSDWYRQDEGTVYSEFNYSGLGVSYAVSFFETANTANRWYMVANNSVARAQFVMRPNGVVQADLANSLVVPINTMTKAVATYKVNDFALSQNGLTVATDVSGYLTNNIDQVRFGKSEFNAAFLNGTIKKIAYYPTRLSNLQLQSLTS